MRARLVLVTLAVIAGCGQRGEQPPAPATSRSTLSVAEGSAAESPAARLAALQALSEPLAPHLGRCVRVTGYLRNTGFFPQVAIGTAKLWVRPRGGNDALLELPSGGRVEVRGVVREREDLPVFVHKPGERPRHGMPLPDGTDLDAARRRLVIDEATVTVLAPSPS